MGPEAERIIKNHPVVSAAEWLSARTALLAKEKEFTRLRDELSRQRRELPWVRVEKTYLFEGPEGRKSLLELFQNRSQLLVYHFMFSPEWSEGCPHCSFWADNFDGIGVHLNQRDTRFVAISRAPWSKIEPFKKRMGWSFDWLSASGTDFNYDYHVSFTPEQIKRGDAVYNYRQFSLNHADREGVSAFYRDERGNVFHTYSCYERGIDLLNTAYNYLDLTVKGRDEDGDEFPQAWVRHHDRYPHQTR
jgi:predicted dithiol-disulfide oxidoreductase (DUF899 family)